MIIVFWALLGALAGYGCTYMGYRSGMAMAETRRKLKAIVVCKEGKDFPTIEVDCPCLCGGVLEADGRDADDEYTFLLCTKCKCLYHAEDSLGEVTRRSGRHLHIVEEDKS